MQSSHTFIRYENDDALMECEGCGEAAPSSSALAGSGGKSAGGFVVGLLKSAEAVAGKDKLKVRFFSVQGRRLVV